MARGGGDPEVSMLREELLRAQSAIVRLQQDNERLQRLHQRGHQLELQQERLALLHRHMFQEVELFEDQTNLNLVHQQQQPQQELLLDGQYEEFQNLDDLLLEPGEEVQEEVVELPDSPPAVVPEENQELEKKNLNIETMDDKICPFCEAHLPTGTASSHYGSCPEFSRWSGGNGDDSFFYQPSHPN